MERGSLLPVRLFPVLRYCRMSHAFTTLHQWGVGQKTVTEKQINVTSNGEE
jgi:hypothetical protein